MIAIVLAAIAAFAHAATAWRYGYFRDELYFIACSKHLAWGYVDQPPMVALAAWLAAPAAYQLLALRALPVVAATLTVYVSVRLTRELGGGTFAQIFCGFATLTLPAYLLLGNTLTTSSFEPFFWTLTLYLTVRLVRAPAHRAPLWWPAIGVAVALGAYAKYSIALLAAAIVVALLATPERRVLRAPYALCALGLGVALIGPNLAWQAVHGWPIVDVLGGDLSRRHAFQNGLLLESYGVLRNAPAFLAEQFVYTNPVAAPVWLIGAAAPFRIAGLRDLRFVTIAFVLVIIAAIALDAKGYYVVGLYATLLAIGAAVVERAAVVLRGALFAVLAVVAIAAMPLSLPVLPVDTLITYTKVLTLTGADGTPPHLIQPVFAEEFGWERLTRDVASAYFALPAAIRTRTAIYADTYGDAGALDFFGPRYGLPPPISSQNNYYLWGTRGYDGSTLLAIGATQIERLRHVYRRVRLVSTSTEPYKWVVEGPAPIYLCRDPVAPLPVLWPALRWYGA